MRRALIVAVGVTLLGISSPAEAFKVGQKVSSFQLSDSSGKAYTLHSFRRKVLMVWYEGAKSKEQNRWLKDRLKKIYDTNRINQKLWESVGIANFQEHWISNAIINAMIRSEAKATGSLILCDRSGKMMKQWGFRNGRSNIYMLDKSRVLRWKTSGPLSRKRGQQLIRLLRRLTRE